MRLFDERGRDVTASGRGQPGCRGPLASRGLLGRSGRERAALHARRLDARGRRRGDRCRRRAARRGPHRRHHHPRRQEHQRARGRGGRDVAPGGRARGRGAGARPGVRRARVRGGGAARGRRARRSPALVAHLREQGVSVESWPEHLVVLDELPRSSGGKIAKGALRELVRERLSHGEEGPMSNHITRYDQMPIPPVEAQTTWFDAGAVRIGVEYRLLNDAIAAHAATAAATRNGFLGRHEPRRPRRLAARVRQRRRRRRSRVPALRLLRRGSALPLRVVARDEQRDDPHRSDRGRRPARLGARADPHAPPADARARGRPELAARVDARELERALPRVAEAAYRARYHSDPAAVLRNALG